MHRSTTYGKCQYYTLSYNVPWTNLWEINIRHSPASEETFEKCTIASLVLWLTHAIKRASNNNRDDTLLPTQKMVSEQQKWQQPVRTAAGRSLLSAGQVLSFTLKKLFNGDLALLLSFSAWHMTLRGDKCAGDSLISNPESWCLKKHRWRMV